MTERTETSFDISGLLRHEDAVRECSFSVPMAEEDAMREVVFQGTFKNISGVLTLKADISGIYRATCDRCLEEFDLPLEAKIDTFVYVNESKDDSVTVANGKIDLVKTCYDALSLELPLILLCREDCKGLCFRCGTNLNEKDCGCEL